MHYYSQFNEREKKKKMACWFLLSLCLALKVEMLGYSYPQWGEIYGHSVTGGIQAEAGRVPDVWDQDISWVVAPSGWKFRATPSLERSKQRLEGNPWWVRLRHLPGTGQGDVWKAPYSIPL